MKLYINEIRKRKKVTQAELARRMGISIYAVKRLCYEGKKGRELRVNTVARIAEALDVPIWRLLYHPSVTLKQELEEAQIKCPRCGKKMSVRLDVVVK